MPETEEEVDLLTLAKELGVTPETMRSWCSKGMPHYRSGSTGRITGKRSEVNKWRSKNQQED